MAGCATLRTGWHLVVYDGPESLLLLLNICSDQYKHFITTRQAHLDSIRAAAANKCWVSWAPKSSPSACASYACDEHAHLDVSVSCWYCGHCYGWHYQLGCQGWPAHCCSCPAAEGQKPTKKPVCREARALHYVKIFISTCLCWNSTSTRCQQGTNSGPSSLGDREQRQADQPITPK